MEAEWKKKKKKGGCVPFLLPLFDNGKVKYFPIRSLFIRSFIRCFNLHFFYFRRFFRFCVLERWAALRRKIVTRLRFFAFFLPFLAFFFFVTLRNFLISSDFLRFSFWSYFSPPLHRRLLVLLRQSGYSGAFVRLD